jgi:hypothetical protein
LSHLADETFTVRHHCAVALSQLFQADPAAMANKVKKYIEENLMKAC